jgi:hypothetical protein
MSPHTKDLKELLDKREIELQVLLYMCPHTAGTTNYSTAGTSIMCPHTAGTSYIGTSIYVSSYSELKEQLDETEAEVQVLEYFVVILV